MKCCLDCRKLRSDGSHASSEYGGPDYPCEESSSRRKNNVDALPEMKPLRRLAKQ